MSIIKLPNISQTTVETPKVGGALFFNSSNNNHFSLKRSDGTILDLNKLPLAIYSDYEAGGRLNMFGINWIWFDFIALYISYGLIMELSVQSFIINGSEKIVAPTYLSFDMNTKTTPVYMWDGTPKQYSRTTFTNVTSTALTTPCEWIDHLDALGEPYGFKFIGYDYRDRIYFQDVDWSIKIRRTFDAPAEPAVNQEYTLTYDSVTKTMLLENNAISSPSSTLGGDYNSYGVINKCRVII